MPRPRYSGATVTLDTPAIGTGRPPHPPPHPPSLPHVLERGRGGRADAGEGAQVPPGGDEPGHRPDPPVTVGGGPGPEGPFGQVARGGRGGTGSPPVRGVSGGSSPGGKHGQKPSSMNGVAANAPSRAASASGLPPSARP